MPVEGVDTIYTCRKYFGVSDGAFLYTDTKPQRNLPQDESYDRMHFLMGRYERSASEFYNEYVDKKYIWCIHVPAFDSKRCGGAKNSAKRKNLHSNIMAERFGELRTEQPGISICSQYITDSCGLKIWHNGL